MILSVKLWNTLCVRFYGPLWFLCLVMLFALASVLLILHRRVGYHYAAAAIFLLLLTPLYTIL